LLLLLVLVLLNHIGLLYFCNGLYVETSINVLLNWP